MVKPSNTELNKAVPSADPSEEEPIRGEIKLEDFVGYLPESVFIDRVTMKFWGARGVDAAIEPVILVDDKGAPLKDKTGNPMRIKATFMISKQYPVHHLIWAPGKPRVIKERVMLEGQWKQAPGMNCFNLYMPPEVEPGDPTKVGPWSIMCAGFIQRMPMKLSASLRTGCSDQRRKSTTR